MCTICCCPRTPTLRRFNWGVDRRSCANLIYITGGSDRVAFTPRGIIWEPRWQPPHWSHSAPADGTGGPRRKRRRRRMMGAGLTLSESRSSRFINGGGEWHSENQQQLPARPQLCNRRYLFNQIDQLGTMSPREAAAPSIQTVRVIKMNICLSDGRTMSFRLI